MNDNQSSIKRYGDGSIDYQHYKGAGRRARNQEITTLTGKLILRCQTGWRTSSLPRVGVWLLVMLLIQTSLPV